MGVTDSDHKLSELAFELQQPKTIQDDAFGTLVFDKSVGWYETDVAWGTVGIRLYATPDDDDDDDGSVMASLDVAKALWQEQVTWNRRIRAYAIQELLPLKNESWLEDDEDALTPEAFEARMTLESITVYPDGSFDFEHDDGNLFLGHSIQVCGNLSEGPNDADIPG